MNLLGENKGNTLGDPDREWFSYKIPKTPVSKAKLNKIISNYEHPAQQKKPQSEAATCQMGKKNVQMNIIDKGLTFRIHKDLEKPDPKIIQFLKIGKSGRLLSQGARSQLRYLYSN